MTADNIRLNAIIKVWEEYETQNNEVYSKVVSNKVNLLLELTNTLFEDKIKLEAWLIWSEAIIFKFCYHISSILMLFRGTELPFKRDNQNLVIFDEPSMFILFRSALENYLTFFYLYIDNPSEDINKFRMLVWRYCGLKQRIEFKIDTKKAKLKQISEIKVVDSLKQELIESQIFKTYPLKEQKIILQGRKPRLFESWKDLIKRSKLNDKLFHNIYGYKSNYTHSEFISILQIKDGLYGHQKNNTRSHHTLFMIHNLICKMIFELNSLFPSIKEHYDNKDESLKAEVEFLSTLCSTKDINNNA